MTSRNLVERALFGSKQPSRERYSDAHRTEEVVRTTNKKVLNLPNPPVPMTASILMAYLEQMADTHPIEDQPIMIGGEEVVNARVVDGRVVLQTYTDMLNENPPCKQHYPVQHRDRKPAWCYLCRLTADWKNPHG